MSYSESDLVKVAIAPPNQENLLNEVGFVNAILETGQIEVAVLDTEGLRDIFLISEAFLISEDSLEARNLFNSYKNTLEEIDREADARQRQKVQVTNHLARKFNIGPDEVYGIYKAMLHYEKYHEEHLARKSPRR